MSDMALDRAMVFKPEEAERRNGLRISPAGVVKEKGKIRHPRFGF